eukprot:7573670-Heterocapsa_arctica.AAC.1
MLRPSAMDTWARRAPQLLIAKGCPRMRRRKLLVPPRRPSPLPLETARVLARALVRGRGNPTQPLVAYAPPASVGIKITVAVVSPPSFVITSIK